VLPILGHPIVVMLFLLFDGVDLFWTEARLLRELELFVKRLDLVFRIIRIGVLPAVFGQNLSSVAENLVDLGGGKLGRGRIAVRLYKRSLAVAPFDPAFPRLPCPFALGFGILFWPAENVPADLVVLVNLIDCALTVLVGALKVAVFLIINS